MDDDQQLEELKAMGFYREKVVDEIYSVAEVAEFLKLPKNKVYEMVGKEEIPNFRVGKIILFRQFELIEWYREIEWLSWIM